MPALRSWSSYRPTYRQREMTRVASWIARGQSGSVVGMGGAGKSNFLGFLCHRPEVLAAYQPADAPAVVPIFVDLNILPADDLATFYRVVMRALHDSREVVPEALHDTIAETFRQHAASTDPFVVQTALHGLLHAVRANGVRLVLVFDRFDGFFPLAPVRVLDALRALRDSFKDTLSFIVGMREELSHLADAGRLGELYEILDTKICWIGAMDDDDASNVLSEEMAGWPEQPGPEDKLTLLSMAGGHAALLKGVCHWWQDRGHAIEQTKWLASLLDEPSIRFRMGEIWDSLTQGEQLALAELRRLTDRLDRARDIDQVDAPRLAELSSRAVSEFVEQHRPALRRLTDKGIVRSAQAMWVIPSQLLDHYGVEMAVPGRGTIWRDKATGEIFQGQEALGSLPNLERRLLAFLVDHPRTCHTKSALIEAVWPDDVAKEGIMDDALYQVVTTLRRRIEPTPSKPSYIVTWRGKPEGGYQFFPEGRAASVARAPVQVEVDAARSAAEVEQLVQSPFFQRLQAQAMAARGERAEG